MHGKEAEMANMKQAYIKAVNDYAEAVNRATEKDRIRAFHEGESVAGDLFDKVVALDYSNAYNAGWTYDQLDITEAPLYRQWVQDWELPEPTGKPPKKRFDPNKSY